MGSLIWLSRCKPQPPGTRRDASRGLPDQLRRYVARRNADDYMLGPTQAPSWLEVPRTTAYARTDQKRLLAGRSKTYRLTIPAAQTLGPWWVTPGLGDVIDIVGNAELAWGFLTWGWLGGGWSVRKRRPSCR